MLFVDYFKLFVDLNTFRYKFVLLTQIYSPMKTISTKNAFKLFLFLLILSSAKMFSNPKLPTESNSSDCVSRIGFVKKATNTTTSSASAYTPSARGGNAMQSKNIALRSSLTPRVSLKAGRE